VPKQAKKIALVLGAGSARGLAHIGVLQVLNENNIPVDLIVGCSMGAMIGGIYSCGTDLKMLDKMIEYMDTSIFFDIQVPRMGFIADKKINTLLNLLTRNKMFKDINIPLSVVATDLISGQRIILEEGQVAEAIRASISIPGIFSPVKRNEMVLVDGAVIDRLPIEVARIKKADVIIAVDVTFCSGKKVTINNTLDVIMTSLDIMQRQQFDLIKDQAEILIQPEVGNFSPRDFEKSRELVDIGRLATEKKLDEIIHKINGKT